MITPRGETLQRETAHTKVCQDDDCGLLTLGLMRAPNFVGASCDEVLKNIKDRPIVDVWGAKARVICNGYGAQAISAGHDGKIGTCDDLGVTIGVNAVKFIDPKLRKAASDAILQRQEGAATVEGCRRWFRGRTINSQGEPPLQRETAQTKVCTDNDCETRTFSLMSARYASGNSCDELRENLKEKPLLDIWGAQVRVICNGVGAQAVSAGRDGRIGTCDDVGLTFPVNAVTFQ